ncbi:LOW QUALITY PROTEIN: ataxin-3-like [Theropithecus gelada]|uniref:LOW QUALITY PROTEIN: ataxin-3-like n=1 Tax=Theropithecus gelada TaxID=9565 RepID=UPI000DC166C6|nr:LOW QUALITY PROTEIN: ataxin-3-like [Theropithecus gelada]
MESIFHEKQEGSLCAQHCLNNLLQGEYFSPVELSSIAHQLDEEERMRMAEGGVTSEDYRTFLQQPSGNMITVVFSLFRNERSFICNYKEHWFTVRKLGKQWFNLNSLLTGPELISDTYLALFLAQLQQEGYSIFVVKGDLPDCEADQLLQMIRVQQMHRPKLIGEELAQLKEQRVHKTDLERVLEANDGSGMLDEDEEDLQRALALSRQEIDMEDEEADLRRAIQLSMQGSSRNISQDIPQTSGTNLTSEELRKRREAYFEKQQQKQQQQKQQQQQQQQGDLSEQSSHPCERPTTSSGALGSDLGDAMGEEDMLQAAVTMSLETVRNDLKTEGKK